MLLFSPNFDAKSIIFFPYFGQGPFPKIAGKKPWLLKGLVCLLRVDALHPFQSTKSIILGQFPGFNQYDCKFGNFRENFIFANSANIYISDVKICDYGIIYLHQ